MVAITCNVGKALLGKDSFQEIDIAGVAMPITKYSVIVKDITVLADTLRRAFTIAKSGRPGPFWSILQKMSQRQRMSTSRRLRRKLNRLLRELQKKA